MNYLFLAIAIMAEVIGTTFMKQSDGFTKLVPSIVTVFSYVIAFYCLSLTLKTIPTGVAYAIWSGAGIIFIAATAWVFQGQKMDTAAIIGIILIVTGVLVMNIFSSASPH